MAEFNVQTDFDPETMEDHYHEKWETIDFKPKDGWYNIYEIDGVDKAWESPGILVQRFIESVFTICSKVDKDAWGSRRVLHEEVSARRAGELRFVFASGPDFDDDGTIKPANRATNYRCTVPLAQLRDDWDSTMPFGDNDHLGALNVIAETLVNRA